MDVYVAVLHDRHCDDTIALFTKFTLAVDQAKIWQAQYKHGMHPEDTIIVGWLYHVRSECDDGPWIHIEKQTLNAEGS